MGIKARQAALLGVSIQDGEREGRDEREGEQETEMRQEDKMKRQIQFPVAAVSSDVEAIMWSTDTERAVTVALTQPTVPSPGSLALFLPLSLSSRSVSFPRVLETLEV